MSSTIHKSYGNDQSPQDFVSSGQMSQKQHVDTNPQYMQSTLFGSSQSPQQSPALFFPSQRSQHVAQNRGKDVSYDEDDWKDDYHHTTRNDSLNTSPHNLKTLIQSDYDPKSSEYKQKNDQHKSWFHWGNNDTQITPQQPNVQCETPDYNFNLPSRMLQDAEGSNDTSFNNSSFNHSFNTNNSVLRTTNMKNHYDGHFNSTLNDNHPNNATKNSTNNQAGFLDDGFLTRLTRWVMTNTGFEPHNPQHLHKHYETNIVRDENGQLIRPDYFLPQKFAQQDRFYNHNSRDDDNNNDPMQQLSPQFSVQQQQQQQHNPIQFRSFLSVFKNTNHLNTMFDTNRQFWTGDSVSLSHSLPQYNEDDNDNSDTFATSAPTWNNNNNKKNSYHAHNKNNYDGNDKSYTTTVTKHFDHLPKGMVAESHSTTIHKDKGDGVVSHTFKGDFYMNQDIDNTNVQDVETAREKSREIAHSMQNLIRRGAQQLTTAMDKAVEITSPQNDNSTATEAAPRSLHDNAQRLVDKYEHNIREQDLLPDAVKGALLSAPDYVEPLEESAKSYKKLRRHAIRTGKDIVTNAVDYIVDEFGNNDS